LQVPLAPCDPVVIQLIGPSFTLAGGAGGSQSSAPAGIDEPEKSARTSIAGPSRRDRRCGRIILGPSFSKPCRRDRAGGGAAQIHIVGRSDARTADAPCDAVRY
jgi:hypothetical protein